MPQKSILKGGPPTEGAPLAYHVAIHRTGLTDFRLLRRLCLLLALLLLLLQLLLLLHLCLLLRGPRMQEHWGPPHAAGAPR